MIAEQPQRHPVGQPAVPVDKLGVSVEIALLGPPDKVAVVSPPLPPLPPVPGDSPGTGMAPAAGSAPSPG